MRAAAVTTLLLALYAGCALGSLAKAPGARTLRVKGMDVISTGVLDPHCEPKLKENDRVEFHYRLTSRETKRVVDHGTEYVGRPQDATWRESELPEALYHGMLGACIGEQRRILAPASKTEAVAQHFSADADAFRSGGVQIDVDVVSLNGRIASLEPSQDGTGGQWHGFDYPAEHYCDACHYLTERFPAAWVSMSLKRTREMQSATTDTPAALQYDEQFEKAVQEFCEHGKYAYGDDTAPFMEQGCRQLMRVRKRDIVGQLLSKHLSNEVIREFKKTVCEDIAQSCTYNSRATRALHNESKTPYGRVSSRRCEACKASLEDMHFHFRTQSSIAAGKGVRARVDELAEVICLPMVRRHDRWGPVEAEVCQDMVEEHADSVKDGTEKVVAGEWQWEDVVKKVCVEDLEVCKYGDFEPPNSEL
ncbi:unnamed protein product [Pedinophyceae sp. YPF-701]|nr:unnamed protein product [Pedinophyceae sp. YPF-701]